MPITDLDHCFVSARDLERSRRFYCETLGLAVVPRPALSFDGYWLGANGRVQIHLGQGAGAAESMPRSTMDNGAVVGHIAFRCSDPEGMARRLEARGLAHRARHRAETRVLQLFVNDPDGLVIELNFPGVPECPDWARPAGA